MEKLLESLTKYFFKIREWGGGILNPALPWLEFSAIIISALLIWGIIYCIIGSGYLRTRKREWMDILGVGDVGKNYQLRAWRQIQKRLKSNEITDWKLAILEADSIFDEILKNSGYRGDTIYDRFKQLSPAALSNYNEILTAHKIRDQIIQQADFILKQEEAINTIKIYEQAFRELGLIG